ncbi:MAG: AMP-binding protein, partial [Telluria sp.]
MASFRRPVRQDDKVFMSELVHDLLFYAARRAPTAPALVYGATRLNYGELAAAVQAALQTLLHADVARGERVAVFLEKRVEAVTAMFGAAAAGAVFVPVNPLLKAEQ